MRGRRCSQNAMALAAGSMVHRVGKLERKLSAALQNLLCRRLVDYCSRIIVQPVTQLPSGCRLQARAPCRNTILLIVQIHSLYQMYVLKCPS